MTIEYRCARRMLLILCGILIIVAAPVVLAEEGKGGNGEVSQTTQACEWIAKTKPLGKLTSGIGKFIGRLSFGRKSSDEVAPAPFHAKGKAYLANSRDATKYLESLGAELQQGWPGEQPAAQPAYFVSHDRIYDARALFDHGLIMNIGTLASAETDDEMAFILAHEIAHVLLGHTSNQKAIEKSLGQLDLAHDTISYAADLARMTVSSASEAEMANENPTPEELAEAEKRRQEIEEHNAKIEKIMDDFRRIAEKLARPAWTAKQEDAADAMATRLMLSAGYSFYGVDASLRNMQASQLDACAELAELEQSILELSEDVQKYDWAESMDEGPDAAFWKAGAKTLKDKATVALRRTVYVAALPQSHRPWDERIEILAEFVATDEIQSLVSGNFPGSSNLDALKRTSSYRNAARSAVALTEFREALAAKEMAKAAAAIAKIDMQTSQGRLAKRDFRLAANRQEDAFQNLAIAMKLPVPAVLVIERYAAGLLAREQYDEAVAAASIGRELYGDDAHFYPEEIYALVRPEIASALADQPGEEQSDTSQAAPEYQQPQLQGRAKTLADQCKRVPRKTLRKICRAAATGISADFRNSADLILAETGCSGLACSGEFLKRWLPKPKGTAAKASQAMKQ